MSHFIRKCKVCGVVVAQCRCPDRNKFVELVVCDNCIDKDTIDPTLQPQSVEEILDRHFPTLRVEATNPEDKRFEEIATYAANHHRKDVIREIEALITVARIQELEIAYIGSYPSETKTVKYLKERLDELKKEAT